MPKRHFDIFKKESGSGISVPTHEYGPRRLVTDIKADWPLCFCNELEKLVGNEECGLISPPTDVYIHILFLDRKSFPSPLNKILESPLLGVVIAEIGCRINPLKINLSLSFHNHSAGTCIKVSEIDYYSHAFHPLSKNWFVCI